MKRKPLVQVAQDFDTKQDTIVKIKSMDTLDKRYSHWKSKENKILNITTQDDYNGLTQIRSKQKD